MDTSKTPHLDGVPILDAQDLENVDPAIKQEWAMQLATMFDMVKNLTNYAPLQYRIQNQLHVMGYRLEWNRETMQHDIAKL